MDSSDSICPVCNDVIELYAFGECDHPVCYKCLTRMRVLCEQLYCAICRGELPKVVYTRKFNKFATLETLRFPVNRKHKIYFEDGTIQSSFYSLLDHKCTQCEGKTFRQFPQYRDHMRKEHTLFACDLCVQHIKVFSHERKFYDRKALAEHRRIGDKDDKSHKGHPNCNFCDVRYFDKDELVRHLRKDHFYCHFCEADGIGNEYYPDYSELRDHFGAEHYLCEEGECCKERFTNAFRSDIDLKAHKASMHSKNLNKAMVKAARTIDVEVSLPPRAYRGRGRPRTGRRDGNEGDNEERQTGRGNARQDRIKQREEEEVQRAVTVCLNQELQRQGNISVVDPALLNPQPPAQDDHHGGKRSRKDSYREQVEDFPDLDGAVASKGGSDSDEEKGKGRSQRDTLAKQLARSSNFSVQDGSMEEDDFPSLGGKRPGKFANKQPTSKVWQGNHDKDFPSLGGNTGSPKSKPKGIVPSSGTWVNSAKPQRVNPAPQVIHSAVRSQPPNIQRDVDDFPALSSLSSIGNMLMSKSHPSKPKPQNKKNPPPGNVPFKEDISLKGETKTSTASVPEWQQAKIDKEAEVKQKNQKKKNEGSKKNEPTKNSRGNISHQQKAKSEEDFPTLTTSQGKKVEKGKVVSAIVPGKKQEETKKHEPPKEPEWTEIPTNKKVENSRGNISRQQKAKSEEDFPTLTTSHGKKVEKGKVVSAIVPGKKQEETKEYVPPKEPEWTEIPTTKKVEHQNKNMDNNNQETKEKKKKKKKKSPVPNTADNEDFPALGTDSTPSTNITAPVGATWLSNDVKMALEKEADWQEVPNKGNKEAQNVKNIKQSKNIVLVDDDDFPSLGKPAKTNVDKQWGKSSTKNNSGNKKGKVNQEEEEVKSMVKLNGKDKKKGNKTNVSNSENNVKEDSAKERSDQISGRNAAADAIIKEILKIEGKVDKENSVQESVLNDFPSVHSNSLDGETTVPGLSDFPSLSKPSTGPPPGFAAPGAPPGFPPADKPASAPPGFSSKPPPGSKPPPPGLQDVTNHTQQYTAQYTKPPQFQVRNQKLIGDIQQLLLDDEASFMLFKTLSADFRQDRVSGSEYYSGCERIMGSGKFQKIFPELLVLLPDISKQQELLAVFNKNRHLSLKNVLQQQDAGFSTCPDCQQVLCAADAGAHTHVTEDHFPALGAPGNKALFGMGSWRN